MERISVNVMYDNLTPCLMPPNKYASDENSIAEHPDNGVSRWEWVFFAVFCYSRADNSAVLKFGWVQLRGARARGGVSLDDITTGLASPYFICRFPPSPRGSRIVAGERLLAGKISHTMFLGTYRGYDESVSTGQPNVMMWTFFTGIFYL